MSGQFQLDFLVGVLVAISAGIFLGSRWAVPMVPLLACFFLLLALTLALLWRNHGKSWISVLLLCFVAGILRFVTAYTLPENDISRFAGSQATVEGVVTEEPRVTETAEGFRKLRYTISVRKIKESGMDISVRWVHKLHAKGLELVEEILTKDTEVH